MFTVIYSFKVKPGRTGEFEKSWSELTQFIYKHEGSLGSRLHKESEVDYIAYAQWPDRLTWEKSGDKLPSSAKEISKEMYDSCEKIDTLYQLDVVKDLLKS